MKHKFITSLKLKLVYSKQNHWVLDFIPGILKINICNFSGTGSLSVVRRREETATLLGPV
jgi:hypothetical protein